MLVASCNTDVLSTGAADTVRCVYSSLDVTLLGRLGPGVGVMPRAASVIEVLPCDAVDAIFDPGRADGVGIFAHPAVGAPFKPLGKFSVFA